MFLRLQTLLLQDHIKSHLEAGLKTLKLLVVFLIVTVGATAVWAGGPESGFFIGGGGHLQLLPGTGTWGEYDFQIDNPLSIEGGDAVGFNWSDKMLLGIKPMVGFKISPQIALQVGYSLNITKSSQQSARDYDLTTSFEQGYSLAWKQRSLEVIGVFYPSEDQNYYFFGGMDLTRIHADFTLYEGVEYQDNLGNLITEVGSEKVSDKITATGVILGAGIEFPSENNKTTTFISAQYSTAKTEGAFFGTEDFKVGVGGISFVVGVKWFLWNK